MNFKSLRILVFNIIMRVFFLNQEIRYKIKIFCKRKKKNIKFLYALNLKN